MSGSRLLRVAARFPLATFLIFGFSLAYGLAFLWGLAYHGVIPGGGLAAVLHIAPDELTGGVLLLSLFQAALFVTWASNGRVGMRRHNQGADVGKNNSGGRQAHEQNRDDRRQSTPAGRCRHCPR